ncbi:copper resistance protein CopD [Psychrobacter frigidicola]|uniref:Copper resistance protein CopD n=1 Tax=Psychrobacter frigidicola TaxID=45611 RepID=A0A5C7A4W5_9GAMM|nr:CopD family protein [Psychrobacter frigidicola]TXD98451.1 copper resistance protein CopD [Psychrobacter frigidicola]
MLNYILIAHLLGATIWTGGHLILSLVILPKALSTRNLDGLLQFEQQFEKVGMPALAVQVLTGLWMAHILLPDVSAWFAFDSDLSILIGLKLLLLLATIIVAIHARFLVIPTLSPSTLNAFSVNIILVTLLSVSFVVVGTLFRTGFS